MATTRALLSLVHLLLLAGCGRDVPGTQRPAPDLVDEVGAAFADCDPAEISALVARWGMMPAFSPCGVNRFHQHAWSPDGRVLYVQLDTTGYLLFADTPERRMEIVPTGPPAGPAAWLAAGRLAVPVGSPLRLALYDVEGRTLFHLPLPGVGAVRALQRGRPQEALLLAELEREPRIVSLDLNSGALDLSPFPFVRGAVDTFTFTPAVDALVVGQGERTTLYLASTGAHRGTFRPATRGTVHADGRWLALEHLGPPVSIFRGSEVGALPEAQRQTEQARIDALEARASARGVPAKVRPPTLSLVDLSDGDRFVLTSIHGTQFAWYEAKPWFGSLLSWGFEGRQYRRNVLLGDLSERLAHITEGDLPADVEVMMEARREDVVPGVLPSPH